MSNDRKPYSSVLVARYIAATANERGVTINVTKVQKLLYIAYGTHLALYRERLVDEQPQAWPYGPVFPKTRKDLIKTNVLGLRNNDEQFDTIRQDDSTTRLIDAVFNTFGRWTAKQLSDWSHKDDSPWGQVVSMDGFAWGDRIPDSYIQTYFNSIINRGDRS